MESQNGQLNLTESQNGQQKSNPKRKIDLAKFAQVDRAGLNKGKGRENKGKGKCKGKVSGVCDEGSIMEEGHNNKITYSRKKRDASEGCYSKKLAENERPVVHFIKPKSIKEAEAKHTLQHIVRMRWDEHTLNSKGSRREAFYDDCIENFREYYKYPDGVGETEGDRIVRAHLKKNFKQYLNAEKGRLVKQLRHLLESGYTNDELDLEVLKPYYYSQRAWNSIYEYWGTLEF